MEIRTARLSDRHAIAELMTALGYPGTEALLVAVESERAHAF
ncbi:hypothetical protein [Serratia marcescens]